MDTIVSEEKESNGFSGTTIIILTSILCILIGISIYQIGEAHIFEDMAEGMTCESLREVYQEDPQVEFGLPTDESSWWYVGIVANDAMGEQINKRCT